ncbi:MAG: hypothetical protein IT545_01780 [Rhodobacteraceae bacterium]|nr:hypothetical protein [Paracoccaceae bacterium]
MSTKTLTIGAMPYDRVAALRDGRVTLAGYDLAFPAMGPGDIHRETFATKALAVGEVSPSNLAKALDAGDTAYIGLPVFLSRAFRHGQIYVAADSPIRDARDLAGARIGGIDFFNTTAILQRGILQDDFGVDLAAVNWVIGPVDGPEDYSVPAPAHLARSFRLAAPAPGDSLTGMMARGELDAILTIRAPRAFREGRMRRLFADYVATEKEYFARTRQFPIMHIVVLRRDLAEADPALPRRLYEAFLKAKTINQEALKLTLFYYGSLPWLPAAVEEAEAAIGPDIWPYGLREGGAALETFLRYCHEQKVTDRRITMAEMFPVGVE